MSKIKKLFSFLAILFLTAGILAGGLIIRNKQLLTKKAAASTNLYVYPRIQSVTGNNDMEFSVVMNTGTNNVTGIDILLKFDPNIFQINSLERGSELGDFDNIISSSYDNSAGSISYIAFTLDKADSINGESVEILKVNTTINKSANAGDYLLSFDGSSAVSATNESQNVLTDTSAGTVIVLNPTTPPTPSPTIKPTTIPGEPNSCNGTCGSNNNCQTNLFCYQGYCRKPSCSWSENCDCTTPTTSPKPTASPITNSSEQTFVDKLSDQEMVTDVTPEPTTTNTTPLISNEDNNFWDSAYTETGNNSNLPENPVLESTDVTESRNSDFLPWIIGSLVVVGLTIAIIAIVIAKNDGTHKSTPPVIKL